MADEPEWVRRYREELGTDPPGFGRAERPGERMDRLGRKLQRAGALLTGMALALVALALLALIGWILLA